MFKLEELPQKNHLNTSLEEFEDEKIDLFTRRSKIMDPYHEAYRDSHYGATQEIRDAAYKKSLEILEQVSKNPEIGEIQNRIGEINKEIMLRQRKDLANNYLVTEMVINDLYNKLIELLPNDPQVEEIEKQIIDLEKLLAEDKESLNAEGLSVGRVKGGHY